MSNEAFLTLLNVFYHFQEQLEIFWCSDVTYTKGHENEHKMRARSCLFLAEKIEFHVLRSRFAQRVTKTT